VDTESWPRMQPQYCPESAPEVTLEPVRWKHPPRKRSCPRRPWFITGEIREKYGMTQWRTNHRSHLQANEACNCISGADAQQMHGIAACFVTLGI
jgi:hypothetical protein